MFDLNRTYADQLLSFPLAEGVVLEEEGLILMHSDNGAGKSALRPCAGAATDRVAGYLISDARRAVTDVVIETFVVPAAGPTTKTLSKRNIVAGSEHVRNDTAGADMAENCPAPAAGEYCLDDLTGVVTFNAAQAGQTVTVRYRYRMTEAQALLKNFQRSIARNAQAILREVSVGRGRGKLFTDLYDTSVGAYAVGEEIRTAPNGMLSNAGAGVVIGVCISAPSQADTFLGIDFQM